MRLATPVYAQTAPRNLPTSFQGSDVVQEERVSSGKEASTTSEPPSASKPPEVVLSGLPDKAARTAVHMMFKGDTGLPRLVTDTVTDASDNTAIRIMTQTDLQASASTPCALLPRFLACGR